MNYIGSMKCTALDAVIENNLKLMPKETKVIHKNIITIMWIFPQVISCGVSSFMEIQFIILIVAWKRIAQRMIT